MNIYVGNLPKTTTEEAVREAFAVHGEVTSVKLIKDNFSNELRGFGFIEMPSKTAGATAIQMMNGADFDGRKLVVNEARPQKDRRGGGGGGGFQHGRSHGW